MSKAKSNKTKKTVTTPVKSKSAPKKNKAEVSGISPEEQSAPMKAGLAAVAVMPVTKESKLDAVIGLLKRPEAVRESIDPAREALLSIAPYLEMTKWLLLVVTLIGIGVMVWARIDDRQKGLR